MRFFTDKPDWSKTFTGASHLIQLIDTLKYVFAYHYYGDFFSSSDRILSFNNFDVIESRPALIVSNMTVENTQNMGIFIKSPPVHDMEVVNLYPEKAFDYLAKLEAQGIRKAVAHLKENHGGDRYSSSAYLNYADELEGK